MILHNNKAMKLFRLSKSNNSDGRDGRDERYEGVVFDTTSSYDSFYDKLELLLSEFGGRSVHLHLKRVKGEFDLSVGHMSSSGTFRKIPSNSSTLTAIFSDVVRVWIRGFSTVVGPRKRSMMLRYNRRDGLVIFSSNSCTIDSIVYFDEK